MGESRENMTVSHEEREGEGREEPGVAARRLKGNGAVKMVGYIGKGSAALGWRSLG